RGPGPGGRRRLLFPAEEIVDLLKVGKVLQQDAGQWDGIVGKRERARSLERGIRIGALPQEVVGGASATGLVLLAGQAGQELGFCRCQFHGVAPWVSGGWSCPCRWTSPLAQDEP